MARGRVTDSSVIEAVTTSNKFLPTPGISEGTWHESVPDGMRLYKMLRRNGESPYQYATWPLPTQDADGTWTPGEWTEVEGPYIRCQNGLHLTQAIQAGQWASDRLFEAEVEGGILDAGNKWVAGKVRLTREFLSWQSGGLMTAWQRKDAFARQFDLEVMPKVTPEEWERRTRALLPNEYVKWTETAVYAEQSRISKRLDYLKGRDWLHKAQELMGRKLTDKPGDRSRRRAERSRLGTKNEQLRGILNLTLRTQSVASYMLPVLEAHGPFTKKQLMVGYGYPNWPHELQAQAYGQYLVDQAAFVDAEMAKPIDYGDMPKEFFHEPA